MSSKKAVPSTFNYGGQAVIEGVMMRGSKTMSVSVRNPQGEIITHTEPLNARIYGLAKIPFLRGLILLWDAMGIGVKALMFSADVAIEEEDDDKSENADPPSKIFEGPAQIGTVVLSLAMGIGLFIVLPAFLAGLIERFFGIIMTPFVSNLIEGLIRLLLVTGYIYGVGLLPDIRRVYGYHGAEHKTINAYEAGVPLTPKTVAKFPIEHPRCGTAFLLTVVIVSVLIYSLFPRLNMLVRVLSRLALLPVIAGISYEFLRFTAKHQNNPIIRLLIAPNLAMQHLTTKEPDESMLEVAIVSLQHVLAEEAVEPMPATTVTSAVKPVL